LYQAGQGVPKDYVRAVSLFRQSCATGWARGCGGLGECYRFGQGTPADSGQAIQHFEKACRVGIAASCYSVGVLNRLASNQTVAQERLRRVCELSTKYEESSAAYFRLGSVARSGTPSTYCF